MRLLEAYQKLEKLKCAALQTRDAAGILQVSAAHASKILERLATSGLILSIQRGLWAFPDRMDPLLLPRYLAAPFDSYISLQTALYLHDMILQIPTIIYSVTLARTKRIVTPIGEVSLHHIDAPFFFGFDVDNKSGVALARPEKALLDFLYLSSTKSHLFGALPEMAFPKKFNFKKAREMIDRIPSLQRRHLVSVRFQELS